MAASAPDSAARDDTGTYRRRLLVATALSLLLHAIIAGGLATTHLGILSLPAKDGSATTPNIFKPKLAADFPLEVPKSGSKAAAHEKPLDLGTPKQRSDVPKAAAARKDRAVSRQESRETEEAAAVSKRLPDRSVRPREAPASPAAAAAAKRTLAAKAPAAAAAAELQAIKPAEAAREPAAAKPSAARAKRPSSDRAATTASPDAPREVALLSKTSKMSGSSQSLNARPPRERAANDTAPRSGPVARRDVAAESAGASAAKVAPLATTPAAASTEASQVAPAAITPAASARSRANTQGSAASAIAGGAGSVVAGADDAADGAATEGSADSLGAAGATGAASARVGAASRPARDGDAEGAAGEGTISAGLQPASPGRSALAGIGAAEAEGTAVDAVASIDGIEGLGNATGNTTGVSNPSDGGDGLPAPAPRRGSRGGGTAGGAAVSAPVAVETEGEADGLSTEGLSVEPLGDLAAVVGGSRPAPEAAAPAPVIEQTTLPRVAATLLPTEGRVREIAEPFAKRAPEKRKATDADGMVDRGLLFLARAQQADGRWSLGSYPGAADETAPKLASDTAATGLALLSFLGAGHDHFGGRHRDTVRRGLEFLLASQKSDGDLYVPADPLSNSCGWLYSHGIAAMALCEAVGMTGDELVRPAAERACGFISASQQPERGGWRYTPRSDSDLSVSGWMLVALRSGQLAGVAVESRTLDGVRRLLDASSPGTGPTTRYLYNARKPEQRPSELSSSCMTAIGTLMRLHTGWRKDDPRVVEAGRALAAMRPAYGTKEQKIRDCYLWYYMSQVLVHTGGEQWDSWYAALSGQLAATQETSGAAAGSWDPLGATPDRWGPYGGRLYVTTLHLLSLEVPYRHLPTYSISTETR